MSIPSAPRSLATKFVKRRYTFTKEIRRERPFLLFIIGCVFVAGAAYPYPDIARWVGFLLAAYATVANDSIQTVGTFIASNRERRWWLLWLFIGGIFVLTVGYGWMAYDGDVSYGRLTAKGFAESPSSFTFLQVAAPIFLLVLTRLRMPVSTTFLILSCFSSSTGAVGAVLQKSLWGYGVAFIGALVVWLALTHFFDRRFTGTPGAFWMPLQWLSTGFLWSSWIMQDAANIAVYLPRSLSPIAFAAFAGTVFFGLGILFYIRGDRIQQVVSEKTDVIDVRPATVIDFIYAIILFFFKEVSVIPMSTTWVFIGLLAGREIGIAARRHGAITPKTARLIGRDLLYAGIGLIVSIVLAFFANPAL